MFKPKLMGKIGRGNAVHVFRGMEVSPNGVKETVFFAECGADHMTNRGTGRKRFFPFEADRVSCLRCLKRMKEEESV
jgi:hypothetical protein